MWQSTTSTLWIVRSRHEPAFATTTRLGARRVGASRRSRNAISPTIVAMEPTRRRLSVPTTKNVAISKWILATGITTMMTISIGFSRSRRNLPLDLVHKLIILQVKLLSIHFLLLQRHWWVAWREVVGSLFSQFQFSNDIPESLLWSVARFYPVIWEMNDLCLLIILSFLVSES